MEKVGWKELKEETRKVQKQSDEKDKTNMNNCFIENPRTHPVFIQTKFKKKREKNFAQFATAFVKKVNIGKTKKKVDSLPGI